MISVLLAQSKLIDMFFQCFFRACILVFDSLAGASRTRVVATLRDYLTCEYRAKVKGGADFVYNRFNIQGHSVKVPQQTNFTDCGLYLLQYVESFFTVSSFVFCRYFLLLSMILFLCCRCCSTESD